jgi:hypothetical protein
MHEVLKLDNILVDSLAYKHVAETPNVRIDATKDAASVGDVVTLVFDVFLNDGKQLNSSPATTLFAFAEVLVTKLML